MPKKKQPRNAFYYYVLNFKEEQRLKGINYGTHAEAFDAAGPFWAKLPPSQRAKFEEIAKREKQKMNIPDMKFTSTGESFADLNRRKAEEDAAEEQELKEILSIVKLGAFSNVIQNTCFFLMDVNVYCYHESKNEYVIAEMTLLCFSLAEGIIDISHELINPGRLPLGYASDGKAACQELGLEMPDETKEKTNYLKILSLIRDHLKAGTENKVTLPPIFTMPEKVVHVQNFIQQLCERGCEDETLFRVYKLDTLFFHLVNNIKSSDDIGFPRISLALGQLTKDSFRYSPNLGCEHHETFEEGDKAIYCTTSRTKRWAYTVMDMSCQKINIEMIPGRHVPTDYDLEKIEKFKMENMEKTRNPVACLRPFDTSLDVSSTSDSGPWEYVLPKRVHKPVREPKADYSKALRSAPQFAEDVQTTGFGRGRGRAMPLSTVLNQMKLE